MNSWSDHKNVKLKKRYRFSENFTPSYLIKNSYLEFAIWIKSFLFEQKETSRWSGGLQSRVFVKLENQRKFDNPAKYLIAVIFFRKFIDFYSLLLKSLWSSFLEEISRFLKFETRTWKCSLLIKNLKHFLDSDTLRRSVHFDRYAYGSWWKLFTGFI